MISLAASVFESPSVMSLMATAERGNAMPLSWAELMDVVPNAVLPAQST